MMIKIVNIENIEPGMLVGQTIFDNNNRRLILKDKQLTEFSINKLKEMGFFHVYIEDKIGDELINTDIISEELKLKMSDDLQKLNISSTIENAKNIVKEVYKNHSDVFDSFDVRNRNNYIYRHSIMVSEIAVAIGKKLDLNMEKLNGLAIAALFHDLGKLCINKEMLNKIKTDHKEIVYQERMHPLYAYSLLSDVPEITPTVRNAILFHHKNEDGSGFPEKLNMPNHIYFKILHVADAYDNLISSKNLNPADALEYLYANSGVLYNKEVLEAFKECIPIYPRGVEVILSNGLSGIVIDNTSDKARPKIKLDVSYGNVIFDLSKYLDVTIKEVKISNDNLNKKY